MSEKLKRYIGTKIIMARPMTRGLYNNYRGWAIPSNENPQDDGYLVVYPDNYESWSPAEVFEAAYRESNNLTFGLAIEAMKKGHKVARMGWNGKGMFIYIQDGSRVNTEDLRAETMKDYCVDRAIQHVKINPHIDMKAADGSLVIGWLASQADMLAEDWVIVE